MNKKIIALLAAPEKEDVVKNYANRRTSNYNRELCT